jgi:hypothetical protein
VTKITMASEDELQRRADALAAEMARTLSGLLRRVSASLESTITAAAERPERVVLSQAEAAWQDAVNDDFFPRVVDAYVSSAERTHLQLVDVAAVPAASVPFVSQSAAVSYLIDAGNRMVDVSEGTWARARAQLIEGFQAGESIEQLTTRLVEISDWSESRAATVARTEIISASNAGALDQVRSTGVIAKKTWLATRDDRTREAHRIADGQTVSVNNVFIVCGEALDFPGDPEGEPGCVINCRCTMTFDVKKSELTVALEDLPDVTDEFDPADFVDLESLTAALERVEFAPRRKYDESKHRRGKGGRFAPKPGGSKKISYKKPAKKSAPKIDYTKPAKKAAPPPAKKAAPTAAPPPPPPAPEPEPAPIAPAKKSAKKAPGKKTAAPPPAPPVAEPDDIVDEVTPAELEPAPDAPDAPEPNVPLVEVTQDVLDDLSLASGTFAVPGDRVVVGNRAGTVRTTEVDADGLTETMGIQFDDDPTSLTPANAGDAQIIEFGGDTPDILLQPFYVSALNDDDAAAADAAAAASGSTPSPDSDDPGIRGDDFVPVTPGFDRVSPAEMHALQDQMLAADPWTDAQESGLSDYTGDNYSPMNGCLRGITDCSPSVEDLNADAAAAMRPLPRSITTFRGAALSALGVSDPADLSGMVGAVVSDPGFSSTSIDSSIANQFSFSSPVPRNQQALMQIEIPEGAPAAYAEGISQNAGEFEVVMPPGTRFEIAEVIPPSSEFDPPIVRLRVVI